MLSSLFATLHSAALEQSLLSFISQVYTSIHWPGVVVLMAIESACIPLPSELIMPLAGWMLVAEQSLPAAYTLLAGVYGALGCVLGSIVAYVIGLWGGRPFLERYGKYVLVSKHDLDLADLVDCAPVDQDCLRRQDGGALATLLHFPLQQRGLEVEEAPREYQLPLIKRISGLFHVDSLLVRVCAAALVDHSMTSPTVVAQVG